MIEAMHVVSLAPATVGACCSLGAPRRGRVIAVIGASSMLLAMLDAAVGSPVMPPVLWCVLLLALAVITAGRARRTPSSAAGDSTWMAAHSAWGLLTMAALLVSMSTSAVSTPSGSHAAHGGVGTPALIALVFSAGYLISTVVLLRAPHQSWLRRVETAAMGASVAAMAAAVGA